MNDVTQQVSAALPSPMLATFAGMFVLGLVIWLLGRSLAKPACVISGLALGAAGGLTAVHFFAAEGLVMLGGVIGAGIAGALLAAMLFRFWVAAIGAVLLALVVPAGLIVWHGTPPPPGLAAATQPGQSQTTGDDSDGAVDGSAEDQADGADDENKEDDAPDSPLDLAKAAKNADGAIDLATTALRGLYDQQTAGIQQWWTDLTKQTRRRLLWGTAIGAILGLVLGLAAPTTAAALESAVAGAMLMFFPGRALLAQWLPEQTGWLPQSPRWTILWLGLITLAGFWLQWIIARRSADKG